MFFSKKILPAFLLIPLLFACEPDNTLPGPAPTFMRFTSGLQTVCTGQALQLHLNGPDPAIAAGEVDFEIVTGPGSINAAGNYVAPATLQTRDTPTETVVRASLKAFPEVTATATLAVYDNTGNYFTTELNPGENTGSESLLILPGTNGQFRVISSLIEPGNNRVAASNYTPEGTVQRQQRYAAGEAPDAEVLPDGGLVLATRHYGGDHPAQSGILVVDASGNTVFNQVLADGIASAVTRLADGGYALGYVRPMPNQTGSYSGFSVLKTDSQGQLQWQINLDEVLGVQNGALARVEALPGGGMVVAASYLQNGTSSLVLARLKEDGSVEWQRAVEGDLFPDMAVTANGQIVLGYTTFKEGTRDFALKIFSAAGEETISAVLATPEEDWFTGMAITADRQVLLTGFSNLEGQRAAKAVKYSPGGELLWSRFYKQQDGSVLQNQAVAASSTGELLFGAVRDNQLIIYKTAPDGFLPPCNGIFSTNQP